MNILVVGRGWVGRKMFDQLVAKGHVVTFCSHDRAAEAISNNSYHWVVNCAGVTGLPNVDACEKNKKKTLPHNEE